MTDPKPSEGVLLPPDWRLSAQWSNAATSDGALLLIADHPCGRVVVDLDWHSPAQVRAAWLTLLAQAWATEHGQSAEAR